MRRTPDQYSQDRVDDDASIGFMEIDSNDPYDERTNTIKVKLTQGGTIRVFLVTSGLFVYPDPERFRALVITSGNLRSPSGNAVVPGLAFLLDTQRLEEWHVVSNALPSVLVNTPGDPGKNKGTQWVIKGKSGSGIGVREDGSLVLQAGSSEIVLADGITMSGVVHRLDPETRNGILKSNPLKQFALPSFAMLPLPSDIPTTRHLFASIGGIMRSIPRL